MDQPDLFLAHPILVNPSLFEKRGGVLLEGPPPLYSETGDSSTLSTQDPSQCARATLFLPTLKITGRSGTSGGGSTNRIHRAHCGGAASHVRGLSGMYRLWLCVPRPGCSLPDLSVRIRKRHPTSVFGMLQCSATFSRVGVGWGVPSFLNLWEPNSGLCDQRLTQYKKKKNTFRMARQP